MRDIVCLGRCQGGRACGEFGVEGQESISQGLKPGFVASLDVRAKARTYLKSKSKSNSNDKSNSKRNGSNSNIISNRESNGDSGGNLCSDRSCESKDEARNSESAFGEALRFVFLCGIGLWVVGCSNKPTVELRKVEPKPAVAYFKVDPAIAGSVKGTVHFEGKKPVRKAVDMSEDPACVEAHHGKAYDESLQVGPGGGLGNVFVYVKRGLEGKNFAVPSTPVVIDQGGCWFRPRVLGIQVGQVLQVTNSDPVTHNIHPMAQVNREWNHSQGPGDAPLNRKFIKPEIMIRVKCNIHSWMHAFIGVVEHPYFAVSKDDGAFEIKGLPPGSYTLEAWQENLGTRAFEITVPESGEAVAKFTFKGR